MKEKDSCKEINCHVHCPKADASIATDDLDASNDLTDNRKLLKTFSTNPFFNHRQDVNCSKCAFIEDVFLTPSENLQSSNEFGNLFADTAQRTVRLLSSNPFAHVVVSNPFLRQSLPSPDPFQAASEDEILANLPQPPRESNAYCKEWVTQCANFVPKIHRSFTF
ncbi:hypothetical protein NPIL_566271 [Nephila pilipes]|uniref:Uncharacterized protein n=1 Tax=Nephila pilipes TaxID=299642 RepID=A0A8X6IGG8_NEPPI|nr:hypothetical protein NPIL_566271 [Nephila pilipes]